MDFEQLAKIENESERVNRTYDIFNEDTRLNHSKAARVEFLTTVHYIEKYLKEWRQDTRHWRRCRWNTASTLLVRGYEVSALELCPMPILPHSKEN